MRVAWSWLTVVLLAWGSSPLLAQDSSKWEVISNEAVAAVKKVGYPGKTAGVTVDPASGDLFMVIPDNGLWKSADQGKTFARVDGEAIGGRCETGFALNWDPAGKRLMCFMIYGSSALTKDGGQTWLASKTSHLDYGAVDWEATGKCFLALRHEAQDMICLSTDEGQTWSDLGKGFDALGLFDAKTLVATRRGEKGIVRSADGGKTWSKVSDVAPAGKIMYVYKKTGYWTTSKGLLTSTDEGATWKLSGGEVDGVLGPYFGKDETHIVVVGAKGFFESTDAGKSWKLAAPLPKDFNVGLVGPNYAWDVKNNIFYASSMGKDTLKYVR